MNSFTLRAISNINGKGLLVLLENPWLQIRKITKNRKSELLAKTTPTDFRKHSKIDEILF
jgi:hypothetical protein